MQLVDFCCLYYSIAYDMTHHFIECSGLNNFWNVFENCWNRTATYPIQLSNKLTMFGIYYDNTFYKNVNYVILLAKWYIHRQVYFKRNVDFFNFLIVLKSHLHTFNIQWSEIYECL